MGRESIDINTSILSRPIEVCTPQLFQCFQLFLKFSLTLVGSLFELLKDFKGKRLGAQLLPILFEFGMESGARCHCKLKATLYALQVCCMTYEVLPAPCIGYRVDTSMEQAFSIFISYESVPSTRERF
jgi:hypothetical protein